MIPKARSMHNSEGPLFFDQFFRNVCPLKWEIGFNMNYIEKKTGKQDVERFIGIGPTEAEITAVKYRSVTFFTFCQDLCSNLIFTLLRFSDGLSFTMLFS